NGSTNVATTHAGAAGSPTSTSSRGNAGTRRPRSGRRGAHESSSRPSSNSSRAPPARPPAEGPAPRPTATTPTPPPHAKTDFELGRARRVPYGRPRPASDVIVTDDYVIPDPEPKEIDERLAIELRHLAENAVLKAEPQGEERCANCLYYFEDTADISYCW